jgi:hypothetical protein
MFRYSSIFVSILFSIYLCIDGSKFKSSYTSRQDIPICFPALRSSPNIRLQESYDVVVIGAGAAGSIVSAKLATALSMNILLVEAGVKTGNKDNDNITNPAL